MAPDLFLVFPHMTRVLGPTTRPGTFRLWLRQRNFMTDLGNVLTKTMPKKILMFSKALHNKSGLLYKSMRFWEVFALGWCQEIKVLAETPLCLLSSVWLYAYLNMFWQTRIHTYTHTLRNYLFLCEFDAFHYSCGWASLPVSVCLLASLPAYPSVCVYVSLSGCLFLHPICLHVCLSGGCTVLNCLFLPISTEWYLC